MGLLTSLKNFFQRIKWKKDTTKQSQESTSQPSEELPEFTESEITEALDKLRKDLADYKKHLLDFKNNVDIIKEEFDNNVTTTFSESSFEPVKPVFITQKMDSILDFINSCDEFTKSQVLKALKYEGTADKALFLTSIKDNEKTYVVLMNVNSIPEEQGLALAYSSDLQSLSYFLAELTTLSEDDVVKQFGDGNND
jgi:hypothetical protein